MTREEEVILKCIDYIATVWGEEFGMPELKPFIKIHINAALAAAKTGLNVGIEIANSGPLPGEDVPHLTYGAWIC